MTEELTVAEDVSRDRQRPTIAELTLLASRLRRSRPTPSVPNLDLFDDLNVALSQALQNKPTLVPVENGLENDVGKNREKERHSAACALPSVDELLELYQEYNLRHFGGKLPAATVTYSTRMLAAGSCAPSCREIKIGWKYHLVFPEDITDTLLHEMIHLIYPGHDRRFRVMAKKLGVSVHARSHPSLRRKPKYLYRCPVCARDYPRQKRLRQTSCGPCSGRVYNSRFKLALVKS